MELLLINAKINSGPCGKCSGREMIAGLQFSPLKAYEDILFVRDAFAQANIVASTSQTAYHYYQNSGSAMDQQRKTPSLDVVRQQQICGVYRRITQSLTEMLLYHSIASLSVCIGARQEYTERK